MSKQSEMANAKKSEGDLWLNPKQKLLVSHFVNGDITKDGESVKPDMNKLAAIGNYKTKESANKTWWTIEDACKKYLAKHAASKATESGEAAATPAKPATRKRKSAAADAAEETSTPAVKKARTTKARASASKKNTTTGKATQEEDAAKEDSSSEKAEATKDVATEESSTSDKGKEIMEQVVPQDDAEEGA